MVLLLAGACVCRGQEEYERPAAGAPAKVDPAARTDLNHASMAELLKVPGMTRSWAERVVRYRPYRVKTDLLEQGIVTPQVYERIRDYVIVHRVERP